MRGVAGGVCGRHRAAAGNVCITTATCPWGRRGAVVRGTGWWHSRPALEKRSPRPATGIWGAETHEETVGAGRADGPTCAAGHGGVRGGRAWGAWGAGAALGTHAAPGRTHVRAESAGARPPPGAGAGGRRGAGQLSGGRGGWRQRPVGGAGGLGTPALRTSAWGRRTGRGPCSPGKEPCFAGEARGPRGVGTGRRDRG